MTIHPLRRSQGNIEEIGSDQFSSLAEAQRAAWPWLAADVTSSIRTMLQAGMLTVQDGRVVVARR